MTRSNLDRWEDCGEAPQGTSLAQLRSNVLDFRRLKVWAVPPQPSWSQGIEWHISRNTRQPRQAICSLTTGATRPAWSATTSTKNRVKNDMVVGHYTNKHGKLVVGRGGP